MLLRAFFVPDDVSSSSRRAAPGDAMHPARDGGRGGGATVNAWNKPLPRPSMGAPGPDLNVLFSAPPGFPAPPSGVPPTASPTETALQRVYAEIPELRMHAPLGAIFTTNGPIPDPSQSVQALRRAAALELAKARRDFLSGKPLPDAIGPGGSPFTATAVYTALAVDASCGEQGVLGLLSEGSGPGGFGGTGGLGNQQKQSASPPCSVDANLLSVAYARMWRHGTVASAVTNALSGSVSDLQNASKNIGVTVAGPDGLGFVDFGIRRCGEVRSKKSSANAKSTSFFETNMDWPVDSFITRHATVTNHNNFPVLLVLVTQAPEITNTFRVRCDHRSLIRHPADRDLPGNSRNEFEFDETETENENDEDPPGPVVLWPGTSYEVSVDFRPDGRSDAPGHCTQWLLVATVECPIGWRQNTKDKKFTPFPARRHETSGDDFVDVADVKITGARVVAVTTKGSKARREEIRVMLLNPETLRFTPRRLREAFDTVPRALVAPPICLPGFRGRFELRAQIRRRVIHRKPKKHKPILVENSRRRVTLGVVTSCLLGPERRFAAAALLPNHPRRGPRRRGVAFAYGGVYSSRRERGYRIRNHGKVHASFARGGTTTSARYSPVRPARKLLSIRGEGGATCV